MPMNLPNKLTIVRIIMIPFFVFFLLTDFVAGSKWIATVLFQYYRLFRWTYCKKV